MKEPVSLDEIATRIRVAYDGLPEGQRQVAQFLIGNLPEVVTGTASGIGRMVGVSDATVIRFATAIGFSGYAELQDSVRRSLARGRTVAKLRESLEEKDQGGSPLTSAMRKHTALLDRTYKGIVQADFDRAVDMILSARAILCIGLRASASVSWHLAYCLQMALQNTTFLSLEAGFYHERLLSIGRDDLVIAVSLSRHTRLTDELVEFARNRGARVISISDSPVSPVSRMADVALVVPSDSPCFQNSLVGAIAVVEAMVAAVTARAAGRVERNLAAFEALVAPNTF